VKIALFHADGRHKAGSRFSQLLANAPENAHNRSTAAALQ